jgi:hypothetical protein
MMILICHALMQAGFCWVETSFKDRRCIEDMATIVVTTNTLSRANRKPQTVCWFFDMEKYGGPATMNQHPPVHHPSIGCPL